MAFTVRQLVALPDLDLAVVAGRRGLDRPIRWVHTSELFDPTPWLSGGELLLTTGIGVQGPATLQRAYLKRLSQKGLAGLGFGIGFGFERVPDPLARAADREGFPILEVPYPVPFIAIAEAVSQRLAQQQLRDAQMSVEVHERLATLVAEGAGPADVLDEVTALVGGWTTLFDLRGKVMAASASSGAAPPDPRNLWKNLPPALVERWGAVTSSEMGPHGTHVGMAVMSDRRHEGILVFGKTSRLETRDRVVVRHAVTVLGLLLASRRAVVETERRIAGDVLNEAFAGRLGGTDLERRLELVGFPAGSRVTAMVVESSNGRDESNLEDLAWALDGILGSRTKAARTAMVGGRVAALISHDEPRAVAEAAVDDLATACAALGLPATGLRGAVGETTTAKTIRNSYLSAVLALRAAPADKKIASPRDLGSYGLLLGAQPRPVLEGFVRSVLGPLLDRDRSRSSELVASVRAFIEAGGRWEPGAEALGVHRHTLRYRIRQAEELTGRDLSSAEDRLEMWLALKAGDILGE
jgi:purine catabolism regulator